MSYYKLILQLFLLLVCTGARGDDFSDEAAVAAAFPSCIVLIVTEEKEVSTENYPLPYPSDMDICYVLVTYDWSHNYIGLYLTDVDMQCGRAGINIFEVEIENSVTTTETLATGVCRLDDTSDTSEVQEVLEEERFYRGSILHVQFYSTSSGINETQRGALLHCFVDEDEEPAQWYTWNFEYLFQIAAGVGFVIIIIFGVLKYKARARAVHLRRQTQGTSGVNVGLSVPPPSGQYPVQQPLPAVGGQQYIPGSYPTQPGFTYSSAPPPDYTAAIQNPPAYSSATQNQYSTVYGMGTQETTFANPS